MHLQCGGDVDLRVCFSVEQLYLSLASILFTLDVGPRVKYFLAQVEAQ